MLRLLALTVLLAACAEVSGPVPLDTLLLRDSLYVHPVTHEPFTGRVERAFEDDPDRVQIRGELTNGMWNGEIVVYHRNGRVRYQGWLADGVKCGAWTENRDSLPPEDAVVELVQEVEAMGLYPECSKG